MLLQAIVAGVGSYFIYKLTKRDINPKLYVKPRMRKCNTLQGMDFNLAEKPCKEGLIIDMEFNGSDSAAINYELMDFDYNNKGFPGQNFEHEPQIWEIEIHNYGDFPATNIKIEYALILYKADLKFGIDEADLTGYNFESFKTHIGHSNFDYLAPQDSKYVKVLYVCGRFHKAELIVRSLQSDELSYFDQRMIIDTYTHPGLNYQPNDYQFKLLLGVHKPIEIDEGLPD